MTAEDALLNALEAAGLIHEDWQGIDHENLPKDMRDAVTRAITKNIAIDLTIKPDEHGQHCPFLKIAKDEDQYIIFNGRKVNDWVSGATTQHRTAIEIK